MNARLPLRGPERVAAVRDLQRLLAEDAVNAALLRYLDNWPPDTIAAVAIDGHAEWLHGLVDAAHAEAAAYLSWAGVTS